MQLIARGGGVMTTEDRENVFAIALFGLFVAAVVGACCWHASIVDRAAARHFACVDAHKADGLASREAHDACVARGIGHR